MKSEQFRRKNLVEYDGRIFEIHSIAEEFPTLNTNEFGIGVVDWNNIKPIQLTEDWLLKMGACILNKNSAGTKYAFMNESKMIMIASISFTVWNNGIIDSHPEHLTSVHSVQNAFHALTGEEIKIQDL